MTTKQLTDEINAYLKPTQPGQYAVVVSRRFLVALKAHLEDMTRLNVQLMILANEQDNQPDDVQN